MAKPQEDAISKLECELARAVRSYIHAACNEGQEEHLRNVCAALEFLLGECLAASGDWPRSYWVDGIQPALDMLPEAVRSTSAVELQLRGMANWSKGGSSAPFWIEPFFAALRIEEENDAIAAYTLCFADNARDLATLPYGSHIRRVDWFYPDGWRFVFKKGSPGAEVG